MSIPVINYPVPNGAENDYGELAYYNLTDLRIAVETYDYLIPNLNSLPNIPNKTAVIFKTTAITFYPVDNNDRLSGEEVVNFSVINENGESFNIIFADDEEGFYITLPPRGFPLPITDFYPVYFVPDEETGGYYIALYP